MTNISQTVNEKTLDASYMVIYHIAQASKPHTIAETRIEHYVTDTVTECLLNKKSAKRINTIWLFNN